MAKIGTKVQTPHGSGVIVAEEVFRTCERWGVKLDANPFSFPVSFYLKSEVTATPPKPKGCESELYPHNCHIGGCLYCIRFNITMLCDGRAIELQTLKIYTNVK